LHPGGTVAQRLTDKITEAIARAANALTVYTRANQGLPIVMVKALSVAASTTSTLTFTVATDCWVNGITTNVTTAAFVLVNDARVTRIEVAGFLLFEDQGTQCPITNGSTAASDWSLVVKVTFQPTKEGPPGVFTIPAASSSNLSFIYDALALPGASFQITATNGHGSAADTITMNYGAMASPTWVEPDHEAIEP
jgi:hypothetical protein